ncbi:Profilin/allergen [Neoconidiobolus thromboides FSU 785]|nr:Profilin/allergen [Neoconidiobolus thromboides FSU 785]
MSWQAFVDTNLIGSNNFNKALIIDHQNNVWATSEEKLHLSKEDFNVLEQAYEKPEVIFTHGFTIREKKYRTIKADNRSVYGKADNSGGITIVKTNRCYLIGFYDDGVKPGFASATIEELGDQLIEANFVSFYVIILN